MTGGFTLQLQLSEGQLTDPHLTAEEATFSTTHTSQETLAPFLNVKSYTKTSVNMAEFLGSWTELMNPPRRGTWRSQVKDVYSRVFRDKKSLQVTCVQFNAAEADGAAHDSRQRQDSQQDGPPVSLRRINRNMISNKLEALVSFGLRLSLRSLE